jgi:hypothetical protein
MEQEKEQYFDFQSKQAIQDYSLKPFSFFKKSLKKHKISAFLSIGAVALDSYMILKQYPITPNILPTMFELLKNHTTLFNFFIGLSVSEFTQDMLNDNLPLHKFKKEDYRSLKKNGIFLALGACSLFLGSSFLSSKVAPENIKPLIDSLDISLSFPLLLGVNAFIYGMVHKKNKIIQSETSENCSHSQEEIKSKEKEPFQFFKK